MKPDWVAVLIAGCFVVAAALWIRSRLRLRRARTWPERKAQVVSSRVRLEGSGTEQRYIAEVTYSYALGAVTYFGSLRRNFMLHGRAQAWTGGYSIGRMVRVRCNPANPKDSVLFEKDQTRVAGAA